MRRSIALAALSALLLLPVHAAVAQSVRGVVTDAGDRPVSGIVVLLLDGASHEVARALSNAQGEFRLAAPAAGAYRVRTMRIGFRSAVTDVIRLAANEEVTRRIPVTGVAFTLDTIRTQSKNACKISAGDSTALVAMLWEQVRTALTATMITASSRSLIATTVAYDRTYDPGFRKIRRQTSDIRSDYVSQPWSSIKPDSLRRVGYVVTENNDLRKYYAPGFDMLLSDAFVEDHCYRIETGKDKSRVGIAFEPAPDRKKVPEIKGTLWVDRQSAELRSMEYEYVNVTRIERDHAGGDMEFIRMKNGMWAISRWSIRMPTIVLVPMYDSRNGTLIEIGRDQRVDSIKVSGGELAIAMLSAARGTTGDTLWSRPRLTLAGSVVDSLSGKPVAQAHVEVGGTGMQGTTDAAGRFVIPGMLPGRYTLEVRTPSLDSVNTVSQSDLLFTDSATTVNLRIPTGTQIASTFCGDPHMTDRNSKVGVIFGSVTVPGDTGAAANAAVAADWKEILTARTGTGSGATMDFFSQPRTSDARSDARGNYRICGVPLNTDMNLRAVRGQTASNYTSVRIPDLVRFARLDLTLDQVVASGGLLVGTVLGDTTNRPIAGVEISLPDLNLSARTDSLGAFRIGAIPAGSHRLLVRRLGYGGLDARVDFAGGERIERKIVLNRLTVLDSVVTNAPFRDRRLEEFEEHRKVGLGKFWTRTDLQRAAGSQLDILLRQTNGMTVVDGPNHEQWVGTSTPPMSGCPGKLSDPSVVACVNRERVYYLYDARGGTSAMCAARVYVDDQLLNSGNPADPIDLRGWNPDRIEAMEFYSRTAGTPQKYMQRANAACGVLAIHTRRPPSP